MHNTRLSGRLRDSGCLLCVPLQRCLNMALFLLHFPAAPAEPSPQRSLCLAGESGEPSFAETIAGIASKLSDALTAVCSSQTTPHASQLRLR